ncbi:MAG: DUF1279 super [Cirrosporium novae-zelandiae]|nr:MAG: DUF1279 super [Cirrosporium novae-zelandiae]
MASALTEEQVDRYLEFLQVPHQYHRKANPPRDLEFLNVLHTHQISAVPYETLELHYSKDHKISLGPQKLYGKIVAPNGRGGYCMENSVLFNHLLRALGFQVYTTGVRTRPRVGSVPQGGYKGWVHTVNIVTLADGVKYMLEVGYGGDGATKIIPLVDNHVIQNIGTQEMRLIYDNIPQQVDKSMKLWICQYRNGPDRPWDSLYCFSEIEFLDHDFEVMNFFTSSSPDAFPTFMVLVVKFLRREHEIYGKIMLVNNEVKQNLGGKTILVKTCTTEEERVEALKEYFGILLTDEEREGIRGMSTELPYSATVRLKN